MSEPKKEEAKSFVARVQVGYRIQIPEPLKIVMDLKEGDYVEITLRKLESKEKKDDT